MTKKVGHLSALERHVGQSALMIGTKLEHQYGWIVLSHKEVTQISHLQTIVIMPHLLYISTHVVMTHA